MLERISLNQLGSMIVLFLIGSSSLFLLASDAGKDAWLAVFIGMLGGLVLLWGVNLMIFRNAPRSNLIEVINDHFGKWLGFVFSLSYVIYFCYKSIRNVREFGDLINMVLLPNTPISAIMLIVCGMAAYTVFSGVNVFFRMAEFILPIVIGIYVLLFLIMAGAGLLHLENVLPVLDEGIKPVLKAAFPGLISFPFGELVLFLMYWKYAEQDGGMIRVTMKCYIFSGLFITLTNLLLLSGLGKLGAVVTIPFLHITKFIQVAKFLERIDPLVALLLFTGVYFKLTAYFMGAVLALRYLMKIPERYAVPLIGCVIFFGSFLFRNYMEQVSFGFQFNLKYHFPIFQIAFPLLLLIAVVIKKRWNEKVHANEQSEQ
ncbi:GerAB/ArcD/ProY family transporter [Paenibacillus sp. LHD-117]|uniref:GerAB/ArcD/ProY family transporter n=1 Tax=Paenibacillus sp. LHD-117 TaxID=3071412 RepID=UPI0027DF42FE|nr:GerAB/ArcD/ProY family transporter [Paenibacillus sp. LHD-117]MDQ6418655.1 GerAB/ArcD/ProY family transporter [Paenibacillus sp. LHD-117]